DERADAMLTAEFDSCQPAITKQSPEESLRNCRALPKIASSRLHVSWCRSGFRGVSHIVNPRRSCSRFELCGRWQHDRQVATASRLAGVSCGRTPPPPPPPPGGGGARGN